MKKIHRKIIGSILFLGFGILLPGNCMTFIGLVSEDQRSHSQEMTSSALSPNRSFLKAKQWFTYRLEGDSSKIIVEDQKAGILQGKGFLICRVPYGVDRVDVEFHEFEYDFLLRGDRVTVHFKNIYSFSKDPNDITISYGPKTKREARITIRKCFEPLAEDLFGHIQ